jgi:epoxyqueuosine reductase
MNIAEDKARQEQQQRASLLSRKIKERAHSEGFQKVGIVRAEALDGEALRLREWLDRGFHGQMQWMARDPSKRTDPRILFPQARSLVVVALNYYTPHEHSRSAQTGKISRYAWGDDYHEVVGEKLRSLLAWIREQWPEAEGKACVDIQPVMDKAWAVRAALEPDYARVRVMGFSGRAAAQS